jgi:hypothetical protein
MRQNITLFFAILTFNICFAQTTTIKIPPTKSGLLLNQWLDIFASGNQTNYQKFFNENYTKELLDKSYSAEWLADRQARRFVDTKKYNIKQIELSSDNQTTVLAQADLTGLWFRISLKLDSIQNTKIADYIAQRIPPPVKYNQLSPIELTKQLTEFLNHLTKEDGFSGSVLIAKNDNAIFKKSYNYADKGHSVLTMVR